MSLDEDPKKALEWYERSLDAAFKTSDPIPTAAILLNMGFLLHAEKDLPRAKHCLSQGLIYLQSAPPDPKRETYVQRAVADLKEIEETLQAEPKALPVPPKTNGGVERGTVRLKTMPL